MKSKHEDKIKEQAQALLDPGEEVLSAFIARPRGWTQTMAGVTSLGGAQQAQNVGAGERAEFQLASPMALALTPKRLVVFETSSPVGMGKGGDIKALVSSAPLSDVDSIELKRLLVGKVVTVTVRGTPIKLEVNGAADAKGMAEAFDRAKGALV